jgi:DNA helicase-2/ATP-dependent DNA helicase PcrA
VLEKESVAVIYRRHVLVENLVRVLRHHDVPYTLARNVNLLDEPLITHVLMILSYITEQYLGYYAGDDALFAIMHFRHFEVPPRDIAKVAHECKSIRTDDGKGQPRKALRDLVSNKRKLKALKLDAADKVLAFSVAIEELCGNIHDDTPHAFLERLVHATGLLRWIIRQPERDWYLQLLKSLMDHCAREMDVSPGLTIEQYITLLSKHQEHLVSIPVKKAIEASHGIELITAHAAKGHEYDRVYMMGCTRQDWEDYKSRGEAFGLPGNLVSDRKQSSIEDDRRLFYVAMTRARRNLTLLYAQSDAITANLEPSRFISELVAGEDTPKERQIGPETLDVFGFFTAILDRTTQFPELIDKALVDKVMEDYKLSATDFNLYLECPRSFYFEKILRIPSSTQLYFAFGNVIHTSLELLFSEYWDTLFLTDDTLLDLFEQEMKKSRGKFTEKEFQDHMVHGRETLKIYAAEFSGTWRDPDSVTTEYRVDNVQHRDIPLKGFLDKVEIRPSTVHIVDYKTGKFEAKKFYPANDKFPLGGAHWRQMLFYKILLDEDPSQEWNVVRGIMDFVDIKRNKKPHRREILFPEDEVATVSDMIVDVYARIRAYDFDHKCTRWRCRWCALIDSEFPKNDISPDPTNQDEAVVHLEE